MSKGKKKQKHKGGPKPKPPKLLKGGLTDDIYPPPPVPPVPPLQTLDARSRWVLGMLKSFAVEHIAAFEGSRLRFLASVPDEVLLEHVRIDKLSLSDLHDDCLARLEGRDKYRLDRVVGGLAKRLLSDRRMKRNWMPIQGGSVYCVGSGHTRKAGSHNSAK